MKKVSNLLFFLFCVVFSATSAFSQASKQQKKIAPIYILGEYQEEHPDLSSQYKTSLLEVCDYDMKKAYAIWLDMLKQMESYAEKVDVDINGVKLFLKIYWDADGKIDYIGFYPKGDSKAIPINELRAFLLSFKRHYLASSNFNVNFSHNATALFPTSLQESSGK